MKTSIKFLAFFIAVALVTNGCGLLKSAGVQLITPSNVIITETREVSGFTSIDMSTMGKVLINQGQSESLNISGSDNLVPLIKTTVSNGVLDISSDGSISVTSFNEKYLTFTIIVKDLSSLNISGLGDIQMGILNTPSLNISMSGAGKVRLDQLLTDKLDVSLSGLGSVEIAGKATQATIDISGAGSVNAPDLQIQSANVTVPGLGSATLWVNDQLTGNISGAGSVSYYGNPQTNTNTSGLGSFKPLGAK